jgi:hypothetical protein
MSFTEKRFVFKARGDVQDELKLGKKTKFRYLGTESITKQGLLHTEINVKKKTHPNSSRNYYFFDGVFIRLQMTLKRASYMQLMVYTL